MYFSRQFIDSLKQSIPLEKLIGQYIELKQHGDHFVGFCPFHDDHTPSFTVFVQTQSFYCFGCHAGSKTVTASSDHIAFLMHYHKLPFPRRWNCWRKSPRFRCQISSHGQLNNRENLARQSHNKANPTNHLSHHCHNSAKTPSVNKSSTGRPNSITNNFSNQTPNSPSTI